MSLSNKEIGALFDSGLNCAQITLTQFCEAYGTDKEMALKIACGFGGGVRCGEVCGAVTGGTMALGLKCGMKSADDKDGKAACYAKTVEFTSKFKEKNGSIVCRELLGCDLSTQSGAAYAKENNLFRTTCVQMVSDAIGILKEMEL